MNVKELLTELLVSKDDSRIVYSDEFIIGVDTQEEGKFILETSPDVDDEMFDVIRLKTALEDIDGSTEVYVNGFPLDDAEEYIDFKEFDLYTEEEE